jgi:hypothetical protein
MIFESYLLYLHLTLKNIGGFTLKYLKWIFIASLILTTAACNVEAGDESNKLNWNENLEEAIKIAGEENLKSMLKII